ncbi:MAG: sugar transferase [Fusicatenibacter saccharivorans]|nr:sugar transferase [Fusicatenibacter saccharivorans]MDY5074461.1 sugar transferase [Fusicatenibacter saccharivorans]
MRESGIYQMYLKNLLDRLLALVGTAALSWLLILLGIAIHLDSPGPIFFRQKRAGKNGTYFYIYKFRTMRMDTPHDMPTHMLNNPDLFITRVGSRLSTKEQKNLQRNGNTAFCGVFFLPIFRFCPYYGYQHV